MRRIGTLLAFSLLLAGPAAAAGPKFMPPPTSPALARSTLYANATGVVDFLSPGVTTGTERVGGVTPTTNTGTASQTAPPTLSADSGSGWPMASFTPTTQLLRWAGKAGNSQGGMTLFCVVRYTSGFAYPAQQIGNNGLYLQLATSSGSNVSWGPGGTMQVGGVNDFVTAGHRTLIALSCPAGAGAQTVTGYRYDYDATTPAVVTATRAFTPGFTATAADLAINNQNASGGATFDLYCAGFLQTTISAADFAALAADPLSFARVGGGFVPSPGTIAPGTTTTLALDGSAQPGEVGSRFVTDSATFAVSDPLGNGNAPTVTAQSVASETSASVTVSTPAGAAVGARYQIQHTGGTSRYAQYLTVGAAVGPATGYTLAGPTTAGVNVPSSSFTATPTPAGATWPAGTTLTLGDAGSGGVFSPAATLAPAGAGAATFTYTATAAGAKTITVLNDQGLTSSPGFLTVTAGINPLAAGTIAFGAMTATGVSGGQVVGDLTITGTAATGGVGPYQYEWYQSPRVQDLYYSGVPPTTAQAPPAAYRLAGQSGPSVTLHNLPYQQRYCWVRLVRDLGQGGTVFDAALWSGTTSPVMVGGFFRPLRVGLLMIGDSHVANSASQSTYGASALGNGLASPIQTWVVTPATYAVGGSSLLQWRPDSTTRFPDAANTSNLNYLNWALSQSGATFAAAGCDIRVIHLMTASNVFQQAGPTYLTDPTKFAQQAQNYRDIRDFGLAFTPKFHALFLSDPTGGLPGGTGGSVFASLYISEDVQKCMDMAADGDTLLRADPFYTTWFHVYGNQLGTAATPDGIHPSAGTAALLWTLDARAIEYALTRRARYPRPGRAIRAGAGPTTGGSQ